jgi:hypothetical protein
VADPIGGDRNPGAVRANASGWSSSRTWRAPSVGRQPRRDPFSSAPSASCAGLPRARSASHPRPARRPIHSSSQVGCQALPSAPVAVRCRRPCGAVFCRARACRRAMPPTVRRRVLSSARPPCDAADCADCPAAPLPRCPAVRCPLSAVPPHTAPLAPVRPTIHVPYPRSQTPGTRPYPGPATCFALDVGLFLGLAAVTCSLYDRMYVR